jgi:lysozyme family protein
MISKEVFRHLILPVTLRFEGGYANVPGDRGGETYQGISRRFNPDWPGWTILDRYKPLTRGDMVNDTGLKIAVADLYFDKYFQKNQFHKFRFVLPALMGFDFAVHGGYNPEGLQNVLNTRFGQNLKTDGIIGDVTLTALNAIDPVQLSHAILDWRKAHLYGIIEKNPSQEKFLNGWENRLLYLRKLINANKNYEREGDTKQ